MHRRPLIVTIFAIASILVGCGGGDSSPGESIPANSPERSSVTVSYYKASPGPGSSLFPLMAITSGGGSIELHSLWYPCSDADTDAMGYFTSYRTSQEWNGNFGGPTTFGSGCELSSDLTFLGARLDLSGTVNGTDISVSYEQTNLDDFTTLLRAESFGAMYENSRLSDQTRLTEFCNEVLGDACENL